MPDDTPPYLQRILEGPSWEATRRALRAATGFHLERDRSAAGPRAEPIDAFDRTVAWLRAGADPASEGQRRAAVAELASTIIESRATASNLADHIARLWKEINFVYEIGESIANPLDLGRSSRTLLELALDVVGARRGSLLLLNDGKLHPLAARGVPDRHLVAIPIDNTRSIAAWVVRHGAPLILNDVNRRPPALAAHGFELPDSSSDSLLCVPLSAGQGGRVPIGVLNLAGKIGGHFTTDDQKLVSAIARLAAGSIQQSQLMAELLTTERLREELRLASEIHEGLLPAGVPEVPGFELAAALRPASAVGGDYYDFMLEGDRLYLLIADVAGHGLGAALLVSTVRSTMRAACRSGLAPAQIVGQLNDVVVDLSGETGVFATAQVVELTGSSGRMAAAAHPPALVLSPGVGVRRLGEAGPPAGALPAAHYPEQSFELGRGETVVLYTDGVLESAGAGGLGGLEASLVAAADERPGSLVHNLLARLDRLDEPADDRTVMAALRRREADA